MNSKLLFASIALGALLTAGSDSSEAGPIDGKGLLCKASGLIDEPNVTRDRMIWFENSKVIVAVTYSKNDLAQFRKGNHGEYKTTAKTISWNYFGVEALGIVTVNRETLGVTLTEKSNLQGSTRLYSDCSVLPSREDWEKAIRLSVASEQSKIDLQLKGNKL